MTKRWQHLWTLAVLLVCLAVPWAEVQAQNDEAVILYRQKVMQSNGASMGAISDILKNKLPYKDHIVTHAKDITMISAIIADAFKQQITEGKTDAKPEIWQDWEKFVTAVDAMEQESTKLAEVAQSDDMDAIAAQVKKLGGTCGDCHKPFRKPKEESYKQQK